MFLFDRKNVEVLTYVLYGTEVFESAIVAA